MYGRLVFTASSRICFYEHSSVGLKWIFILPHPVFRIKSEHNRKPFSDHLESHAIKKTKAFHWCRSISQPNTCQNHIALKLNTCEQREGEKSSKRPIAKMRPVIENTVRFYTEICYHKRQKRWKLHCTLSYLNLLYYLPIDNRYCYSTYEYCLP